MVAFGSTGANGQQTGWLPAHCAGAGTFVISTGTPLVLHSITVNATVGTVTVYDNDAGSGKTVAVLGAVVQGATLLYDCRLFTGLTVVTTGAGTDITVNYGPAAS